MRLSAIGDVAMIVPLVLGLRQQYPSLKITVLTRPFFDPLFKSIPGVHFYAIDLDKKHKGFSGLYRLYKELSLLHIDAFADLHNVLRSKILGLFFRINNVPVVNMKKGRAERKKLTVLKPKIISPIKLIIERHADVFEQLNLPISLSKVNLLSKVELSSEAKLTTGEKNGKWIGIAPFATFKTKIYPIFLMKQVIENLAQENLSIFLFGGGKKEIESLEELSLISDNCINLAGKLNFKMELEVISNLDMMLSMDSGNGHLAALYGVPVITLWGNTHPYAGFRPFRQPEENSITPDLTKYPFIPTSIYGKKVIDGYEDCMASISPEEVVNNLRRLIDQ
jgi:ADP-heptose:LPS heptosyltransferase